LRRTGHEAQLTTFLHRPFGRYTRAYLQAAFANVTVAHDGKPVQQLISLRFPAYAARHPHHVCWMLHRARPYYDLWTSFYSSLTTLRARAKEQLRRRLIHLWDRRCLRRVRRLYALSREVQTRLGRSGFDAELLYPPARHGLLYGPAPPGDYILSPSRLDDQKRIELLIEALAAVPEARAIFTGEGPRRASLETLARERGVLQRVEFRGFVSDAELSELYRHARAVYFCPRREEFGYVALEAMHFGKALITASDSGGPTELVQDAHSALLVEPTVEGVAAALGRLAREPDLAAALGRRAYDSRPTGSWTEVLDRLILVG
jgi:glycosyltransferase involved in cell wall biosynthesis